MLRLLGRRLGNSIVCSASAPGRLSIPRRNPSPQQALKAPQAMGKKQCYAVVRGHVPGLYHSWDACEPQVQGFKGNLYKGFVHEVEARAFLAQHGVVDGYTTHPGAQAAPSQPPLKRPAKRRQQAEVEAQQALHTEQDAAFPSRAAGGLEPAAVPSIGPGTTLRLEFDGASKRNPGPAGIGAALFDDDTGAEVARLCHYMGDRYTNNEAEYGGLIAGMQAALRMGCRKIVAQGDSLLIVNQVLGLYQVKNVRLMPYHATARALASRFDSFEAKQVPRAFNKVADALSNQAIDEWQSGTERRVWTLAEASLALKEGDEEGGKGPRHVGKRQRLGEMSAT